MKTKHKVITGTIDISKIRKERFYKGKKSDYMNITIFINDDADNYGNNGFIIESLSKDERDQGIKGNIVGNVKYASINGKPKISEQTENDLPF